MIILVSIEQLVWIRLVCEFAILGPNAALVSPKLQRELGMLMQMLLIPWTGFVSSSYQTQQTQVVTSF